jgi:O-antigen ligase
MTAPQAANSRKNPMPRGEPVDWGGVITHGAFLLALAAAITRCLMTETLRQAFPPAPGPLGPGPATSVVLDLVCCVPALLVLIRRSVDPVYVIRWSGSHLLMLPLAIWMAISFRWSDDRFAAIVGAANFVGALALLWSASQLVRSWLRLRLVAAVVFGLLPVFLAQGFYFKFSELPGTIKTFEGHREQMLREHNLEPNSFAAKQFENKIVNGELIGFNTSTNSLAAMLILTATLGVGAIIQRFSDGDNPGWAAPIILLLPLTCWLLTYTNSKAAIISPALTVIFLFIVWRWRSTLARRTKLRYWGGVAVALLAMAAVVGHGLFHKSLPTASLNFRWRYWTAAWTMFWRKPVLGVGWDNFGLHYLRDRLPNASEEIRDPHNFLIRFFLELGAVGGVLVIAWLLRLWWELTRPIVPAAPPRRKPVVGTAKISGRGAMGWLFGAAALCIAINIAAGIDFSLTNISWLEIEILKRIVYFVLLALGAAVVAIQSMKRPQLDDRPAPWLLYSMLIAVGVFLIHNLIEFSLFEPGPLCLTMLLIGSALGVRQTSVAGQRRRTPAAVTALFVALAGWLVSLFFLAIPVAQAETAAHAGDVAIETGRYDQAVSDYQHAWFDMPLDADYAYRVGWSMNAAAVAGNHGGVPDDLRLQIAGYYDLAIENNPSAIMPYLQQARLALGAGDKQGVVDNFSRALQLNPNDVSIRLNFARALEALHQPARAKEQLETALRYDDMLDVGEPKRLSAEQIESIRREIGSLPTTQA